MNDHIDVALRHQCAAWALLTFLATAGAVAGVNLARVKKMYLGLGNRTSPAAGGTGRIFIDDIRVIKSATP